MSRWCGGGAKRLDAAAEQDESSDEDEAMGFVTEAHVFAFFEQIGEESIVGEVGDEEVEEKAGVLGAVCGPAQQGWV